MASPHLLIAGPIGAGKSTLAHRLADALGYEAHLESAAEHNPFLEDMYAQLAEHAQGRRSRAHSAFHVQVFFLTEALRQASDIAAHAGGAIQDRSAYEHLGVFVADLHRGGHLTAAEVSVLHDMTLTCLRHLPAPDLLIRLHAPVETLQARIRARGRDYELDMDPGYLASHAAAYDTWMSDFDACPVLHLDVSALDPRTDQGLDEVLAQIRSRVLLP